MTSIYLIIIRKYGVMLNIKYKWFECTINILFVLLEEYTCIGSYLKK